ncbi:UDP-glucose dehydrogenase family protein [Hoeflea sp. Naph1]|uniref:UDP-glucose dehydrogenase family protein n=1 Tax=Hoeflea sp. Naph1 TaxID=3388653 RepID=UPI00398FDD85
MKISIIGAGYVGLVSGACFAELGWKVTCFDNDETRIDQMRQGVSPIFEPGLDDLLARHGASGHLSFQCGADAALASADLIFIAVGTPMSDDGKADLFQVIDAITQIVPHLSGYTVIVLKSTVPIGTNDKVEAMIRSLRPDADFDVCSNPEFLREGSAVQDFMQPDRILIGSNSQRATEMLRQLYRPLEMRDVPIMTVSRISAELAKYAANTFLAMKISFINEISDLSEKAGANVSEVAMAIGKDHRIGEKFLHPGPGYGGSCFPKDVSALIFQAREFNSPVTLVEQVQKINIARKLAMVARIVDAVGGELEGKTIGILGVTFKPNTDDMRDAASLTILPSLIEKGAKVMAYDPIGMRNARHMLPRVNWMSGPQDVFNDADCVAVLTEWGEFNALDLIEARGLMRGDALVDLRNVFTHERAREAGLRYYPIGTQPSHG